MKILITGATGFLGSRLLRRLAALHEIWTLSRRMPALRDDNIHPLQSDLTAGDWATRLPKTIDVVIHLAQSSSFRDFPAKAAEIYAMSAGATMQLLDWAHRAGARQFILGSTGGLYGACDDAVSEATPISEQHNQLGFYFAGKRSSELLAGQYSGLMVVAILRFFFVYGSGQSKEMLMPRLAASIQFGQPVRLQGEQGIRLNPIHVDDAVIAVERCLELPKSEVINVAGPQVITLRAVAKIMGEYVGRSPIFMVEQSAAPRDYIADIARMTRVLGAPQISIRDEMRGATWRPVRFHC